MKSTRFLSLLLMIAGLLAFSSLASATTLTYDSWMSSQNFGFSGSPETPPAGIGDTQCTSLAAQNTACQFELKEFTMYDWKIAGINLGGQTITSASITIQNVANFNGNPNELFMHLLNTAVNANISKMTDNGSGIEPAGGFVDYWNAANFGLINGGGNINNLYNTVGAPAASNTYLNSGTATYNGASMNVNNIHFSGVAAGFNGSDFVYTFNSTEITALTNYIAAGGDVALGFSPDSHFWNDGIVFTINTSISGSAGSAPEPATLTLLGIGLIGLARRKFRRA